MTAHALYRFYDESGVLLYVGITANIGSRFKQHSAEKPWWTEVDRITLEHHPDRPTVLEAERRAIQAEAPRHNIAHNRGRVLTPIAPRPLTVETMTPEQFAGWMLDRHPRVHGPWPKPEVKFCFVCGEELIPPVGVVRRKSGYRVAHRECSSTWHREHPGEAPDTLKAFRDERREAILRGDIA